MYADRGEDEQALAEYKLVEQSNPLLPDVHYEIGHLEWELGDAEDALAEFQKELAIDPYHAEANSAIGSILLPKNQPLDAIPYLEAALRIDPELTLVHQQLGKAYVMLKDYKKAEPELQKAAESDLDGSAHYLLFLVYRAEGRIQDAMQALERCKRLKARNTSETQYLVQGAGAP
jgi:tetratricopeptide (TPR) repeat protein